MSLRTPALARPITIGASTVTIDYSVATTEVVNITAATRYNDQSGDAASDLWAYVLAAINAASAFTWTAPMSTALPYGRRRLSMVDVSDFVVSVTFSDAALARALGYSSTTPAVSVTGLYTSLVIAPWTPKGYWTPHSQISHPLIRDPFQYEDAALVTQSPLGSVTVDDYGGVAIRAVEIARLWAASALECYRADSDFHGELGDLSAADPHFSWEGFRRLWLQEGGAARYYPDRATPASYSTVYPRAPWIASSSQGLRQFGAQPLTYDLAIDLVQTS